MQFAANTNGKVQQKPGIPAATGTLQLLLTDLSFTKLGVRVGTSQHYCIQFCNMKDIHAQKSLPRCKTCIEASRVHGFVLKVQPF